MYYKITNQSSEVFKNLHTLRSRELEIEEENKKTILEKTGMTWNKFLGDPGQQHFRRVTQYEGFEFDLSDQVNQKVWRKHKKHSDIWVPNSKTKAGREMQILLFNGLKSSPFHEVFTILGLERPCRFTYPFVEICESEIILYLGDYQRPKNADIIEITSEEFEGILEREQVRKS